MVQRFCVYRPLSVLTAGVLTPRNCRDNLTEMVEPYELGYINVSNPITLFQYTRYAGRLQRHQ